MIEFYAPEIETSGMLPPDESKHCVRVLRMKEGDTVWVVDGRGNRFRCVLVAADSRKASVRIIDKIHVSKSWEGNIEIAVAPTKNIDRIEWLVEKAVEIGVDRIVLLRCDRSERKNVNVERLRRIALSAMKQSLKTRLPEIVEMISLKEYVAECDIPRKFMGYCAEEVERRDFIREYRTGDVAVLIGPEGDFSPAEVDAALKSGFLPVTFGNERLRTETAALFALQGIHILQNINKNGE